MTRCKEFYDKWERDPNWCEKDPSVTSRIDSYFDLLRELKDKGAPDLPKGKIPERAIRPLFAIKDQNHRDKAISHIISALNRQTPNGGQYKQKLTTNDVTKIIRKAKEEIKPTPPIPSAFYSVIYADPPWEYYFDEVRGAAKNHYQTMPLEELKKLQLPQTPDCVLFLWATNPKLEDALELMREWGFEYKTNMVWVKPHFGNGYYVRGQHELLLIGRRGNIPVPEEANRPSSIIEAPTTEHSAKPPVVYDIIERMYPGRKYLELFARNKRQGWDSWGDELET